MFLSVVADIRTAVELFVSNSKDSEGGDVAKKKKVEGGAQEAIPLFYT
jgi:hypothetical protein